MDEEDLYDQMVEPNRCTLIKYIETEDIVDELRQKKTISVDDYDEVHACAGRRRRTAKLLDILQTKGDRGVQDFFKTIEMVYPDLYQAVTGKSPQKPPPNYLIRSSRMPSLHTINHLPQLAQDLKTQYQNNKQLVQQLQELENAMVFEQNDNKELEKENTELRKRIDSLRTDRDALESQVATFMAENHKLKDESLNYLKTSLDYHQQSELYKQRAREIQIEKDEMERTFQRIRQEHHEGVRQSRLSLGVSIREVHQGPSFNSTEESEHSSLETNLMLQQQILNEKVEEMQMDLANIAEDLLLARTQSDEYQNLYKNVKETCEKLKNERTKMDSLLEKQLYTTNHYFEMIQNLEADKKMLEEERIKEQKKVSEESEKRNKLFMEKHQLEQRNTALIMEVERYRIKVRRSQDPSDEDTGVLQRRTGQANKRTAIYKQECSLHVHPGTVRQQSERSDLEIDQNNELNTTVAILLAARLGEASKEDDKLQQGRVQRRGRLKGGQYVTMNMMDEISGEDRSFKSDESLHTSEANGPSLVLEDILPSYILSSATKTPNTYTIKVATPLLKDKFDIIGGNLSGIYVRRSTKKKSGPIEEGDKILSVGVFISDVQALHTDLMYRTFEEATHILQAQADPKHANMVEVKLQKDPEGYNKVLKWTEKHGSTDCFFIRANFVWEEDSNRPSIQNGDIFCVCSTRKDKEDNYWKAFRFDKGSNSWSKDPVFLPNVSEVLKLKRGGVVTGRQRGRQQAFRHRPYSRVLPTGSNTDYSMDNEVVSPSVPLPWDTKFKDKIHWHKESRLDAMEVEKYRHLLGYSSEMSFTSNSIDMYSDTSNICNSISVTNEECQSL
ncbi:caspase recruitment domain-containing protein 11-like isoform X2 [Ylistrum balloti]|uniref:caspase recruitment domain-containing protein 11-like isoform X2 n=1 Tax=Ylistrum balloti TaxID=509963 RepID=UPI002905F325|nr:caspase recruitment domain-containing protein 11-like isoform X2 [Ylistrum balloti]